jgi:hypothetical protein
MSLDSLKGYPLYQRKFLDVAVNLVKVWWLLGPGHTQRNRYLPSHMERRKHMHMPLAFCKSETRVLCSPGECLSTQHAPSTPRRTSKWSPTHWPNSRTFAWWSRCAALTRRGKGFSYLVQCTSPVPVVVHGVSFHEPAFRGKTDRCSRPKLATIKSLHGLLVPQKLHVGASGLPGHGLTDDQRKLVQRFDPADGKLDTNGFFIAKFLVSSR